MSIYLLTPLANNYDQIVNAIDGAGLENHFLLQKRAGALVSFPGTSVELSAKLGITGQPKGTPSPVGSVLITAVSSYYGRGPSDMWEWMRNRLERGDL